ncbi:ecdysteroid-regulated 16 kDa protein-like [Sitophilus oryzae]|uniref:Ecdysteroid-regulated 16 kDa protein-like n=1 Tax=Sitophilus oryzae TaxID=7048 RepID=A0A6J2YSX4_SITOR|nr:ecdysteroid-regulated 16 kDa protein-like [Sitophilus oryzae]
MENRILVSVAILLVSSYFACAAYTDCGSQDGSIVDIQITNCPASSRRCTLKRNTNATMVINFTPSTPSTSLKAVVHGLIMGVPVPFDLPNPDGCKDSGLSCPLTPGTTYKYTTTMPISTSYPRITLDIKWELVDSDQKDVICAQIPARIA